MEKAKSIQVLLVDDEERFLATATALFRKRNFDVTTAASGVEAIKEIKKGEFDVVVLDIKMPDMDGNEALHEIRKLKPDVEVIMLTGRGSADSMLPALREGAFAYLTKPCDLDLLALKIREAFFKKKGLSKAERRVREITVPISSFGTVGQDWSVAEAIEVIVGHKTIITATVEEEPNYFLESIGVDPELQGRGIGSTLLSYLIQQADRERVLSCLSTSELKTTSLYERFGFQVRAETNLMGVPNYHMIREPKQLREES